MFNLVVCTTRDGVKAAALVAKAEMINAATFILFAYLFN